jgi:uncharacterized membrane protein
VVHPGDNRWMILAGAALIWVALLLAAPLLSAPLALILYTLGSRICHQLPDRSFHLFGSQLPVCARCLGIYLGAAGALVALAAMGGERRRFQASAARKWLLAGATPTIATVLLEWLGAWRPSNVARAVAGAPLGIAVACVVAGAVATLHYRGCTPRRPIRAGHRPTPT